MSNPKPGQITFADNCHRCGRVLGPDGLCCALCQLSPSEQWRLFWTQPTPEGLQITETETVARDQMRLPCQRCREPLDHEDANSCCIACQELPVTATQVIEGRNRLAQAFAATWYRYLSGAEVVYPLKTLVDGVATPAIKPDVLAITRDVARGSE